MARAPTASILQHGLEVARAAETVGIMARSGAQREETGGVVDGGSRRAPRRPAKAANQRRAKARRPHQRRVGWDQALRGAAFHHLRFGRAPSPSRPRPPKVGPELTLCGEVQRRRVVQRARLAREQGICEQKQLNNDRNELDVYLTMRDTAAYVCAYSAMIACSLLFSWCSRSLD